ncbi:hypothetical protein HPP92_016936 [Vanilla planifolia]|uniref:Pentatricopeptide repeat-containing protein n=1 Tax=Vanilla planifolia TaxID=51239 RepID=A0A835QG45_VANPL|nr:hypothetical protein HPP92_016936 [Vanilla planifolia]
MPLSSSAKFSTHLSCDVDSPAARRILHFLSTLTSASLIPSILVDILRQGLHLNSTVTAAFISCSFNLLRPRPALFLFSRIRRPQPFVCNTLMQSLFPFRPSAPLFLFHQMHLSAIKANHHTFPLVLKSLSFFRFLRSGSSIHSHVLKLGFLADPYVSSSLLHFYTICSESGSDSDKYLQLFDELPVRGVVAWSTLIAGLCRDGRPRDALLAFERMHFAGVEPNRITMVNILAACAFHGAALDVGEWIHQRAVHAGWELDVVLGTAIVDMYCKNGRINMAVELFSRMPQRNVFTWNSLILGYAFDKGGNEALQLFSRMEQEGVKPDTVTLIGVLAACGHSGLVEHGRRIFDAVVHGEFGFQAGIKHYGCMVDLYGRAGLLNEAVDCIEKMPFEPNVVIYGSLLAACRLRKEKGLSEFAARKLVELQPENAAHYVLLSNLYVEDGRWREAEEMRRLMKERGLRKDLGRASAEFYDTVEFVEEAF